MSEDRTSLDTRGVYERHAQSYDATRSQSAGEAAWLQRFADALPTGALVLDLGCGSGQPIAASLMARGFAITGIDFAEPMLKLARSHWPSGDWRLGDIRSLDLAVQFHGIVAWDSFFHLTPTEQRAALPRLAAHLLPKGVLLVTVGPKAGEVTGQVMGAPVYHASLSLAEYATLLEGCGLRVTAYLAEDPDCGRHTILMAQKDL